jgi:hypothetical protein
MAQDALEIICIAPLLSLSLFYFLFFYSFEFLERKRESVIVDVCGLALWWHLSLE